VAMLATLLLLRAADQASARRWAAYAASVAVLGYVDLVALCVLAGHAIGMALHWWRARDTRLAWFGLAAAAGCLVCLPVAMVGLGQAGNQLQWLARPGLSLDAFSFFGRNLFYSTAVAAALLIVAVLAWAVNWQAAAFATAIAVAPVVAVWALSQGPHSYFFPRYLLLTVGAWAILAGIALSKLDIRVAAAAVLVFAILGAGDQRVIREPGAHNWAAYPDNVNTAYWNYQSAASIIAAGARPGDGIAFPGAPIRWEMIDVGVEYYLGQDLPAGKMPREVFVAKTAAEAGTMYPVMCTDAASCLGHAARVWIVGNRYKRNPYNDMPGAEVRALRGHYRLAAVRHVTGLNVYLLVRE
jgi:mannosyltransferase